MPPDITAVFVSRCGRSRIVAFHRSLAAESADEIARSLVRQATGFHWYDFMNRCAVSHEAHEWRLSRLRVGDKHWADLS